MTRSDMTIVAKSCGQTKVTSLAQKCYETQHCGSGTGVLFRHIGQTRVTNV